MKLFYIFFNILYQVPISIFFWHVLYYFALFWNVFILFLFFLIHQRLIYIYIFQNKSTTKKIASYNIFVLFKPKKSLNYLTT